jgi:protein-disulfide isomerase
MIGHPNVALAARIIIGIIFLVSAGAKLTHPDAFVHAVQAYGVLPDVVARPLALVFPWGELIVGAFLLFGVFTRLVSLIAALMMLGFILLIAFAMASGKNIDCGCFVGLIEEMVGAETIVRDLIMLVLLVPVVVSTTQRFSLDTLALRRHASFIYRVASAVVVAVVIGALAFGLVTITGSNKPASVAATVSSVSDSARPEGGWRIGPTSAKVTVVVFSDFQCTSCKNVDALWKPMVNDYNGQVAVLYQAFPLKSHQYSILAAEAAEAAGEQGKFWEMHDILFANQDILTPEVIRGLAEQIGLDMNRYDASMASGRPQALVQADRAAGDALGVTFTP